MSKPTLKPLIVLGGGGHASVLVDILRAQRRDIIAIVSPDELSDRGVLQGFIHLHNDNDVLQFGVEDVLLVNGIGVLPRSNLKKKVNQYYLSYGYTFETVIADSAEVSRYAEVEMGAQILTRGVVQAGAKIGSHSVINSGAVIEHDCEIGEYNHIAPSSTLCGQVNTGRGVYVGAGATVIQNITLGGNAIVGAGAIVTQDLLETEVCYPARSIVKHLK